MHQLNTETKKEASQANSKDTESTNHQRSSEQDHLRELYREQQRRRACPGCGEDAFVG
ncbi:hypothetical protein NZK35_06315 [Stieleria sp. ICT_E10.1]|uniref:hypothetical protein n=1 Tax=Stieleria sedimenti TaxID=2976331 RepID=UPI00217F3559|nr:hypothetical protein [Stieleria sedimenti]MCS7466288.1 hypothetical protein [Stieleria sedimenti]